MDQRDCLSTLRVPESRKRLFYEDVLDGGGGGGEPEEDRTGQDSGAGNSSSWLHCCAHALFIRRISAGDLRSRFCGLVVGLQTAGWIQFSLFLLDMAERQVCLIREDGN